MRLQSSVHPLLLLLLRSSELIECASGAILRGTLHADDVLAKRAFTDAVVPDRAHATPMAMTSQFQASLCLDSLPCRRTIGPQHILTHSSCHCKLRPTTATEQMIPHRLGSHGKL